MTVLDLDPLRFEPEPFDIAGDADGEDDAALVSASAIAVGLSADVAVTVSASLTRRSTRVPVWMAMPLPREGLARELGDLGILGGKDARQHLDHRHLGAEAAIEARELDADGARADDEQRLREALRDHRLLVGPDQPAVGLEPG